MRVRDGMLAAFSSRRRAAPTSSLGVPGSRPGPTPPPPPPPRGAPEAAGPAHVAGGPERGARPAHNGGHRRPRAPPPPRAPRAAGALEDSRTGLPGGGGEGESGLFSSPDRGGDLTPSSEPHSVVPTTPQRRAAPGLGALAVAGAAAFPPHSPVDAIFSPSSSFSQRPSPSPWPPRRRTAQARSPQPRALPSGQATGVGGEGLNHRSLVLPPAAPAPILSKGRRLGGAAPIAPEAPAAAAERLCVSRRSDSTREANLFRVVTSAGSRDRLERAFLAGERRPAAGWGKGPGPRTTAD